MKKRYWIFTSTLFLVLFLVEYDLSKRLTSKSNSTSVAQSQKKEIIKEVEQLKVNEATSSENLAQTEGSIFESKFISEAQKISQLQSDPKAVDESIDRLAQQMNSLDIKKLAILIENSNENGDNRAMAVELLTRAQNQESMNALKDFVTNQKPTSSNNWNRNREFESVLRAQAIEGIAAYPQKDLALSYLNSLAQKVDESFLKDRIARSEEYLKGNAPSTQQQDETALKQLVQ